MIDLANPKWQQNYYDARECGLDYRHPVNIGAGDQFQ